MMNIYLQKQAKFIDQRVYSKPEGMLVKLGIKEHELHQKLLKALSDDNFAISFYAARAFINSGNPLVNVMTDLKYPFGVFSGC